MAKSVSVSITANTAGFVAGINRASAAAKGLATTTTSAVGKSQASITKLSTGAGLIGLGLAAGVAGAVRAFANFDEAMSHVAATGADARSHLEALRATAIKAGAETAFSATEAAAGIENLAKAGVSAEDTMGGGLKGALDLAAAGSISVGEAAEIAATALTQFKLEGADIPHVADLLAAGAGKAQGEVTDLAAALKQSGLVAAQFGLSVEDTVGTLSAFASAGLLGSDAGTSFKTMLLRLANPSEKAASTMQDLGIATNDVQGNFIGIGPLAEQLKTKLGGLSQAQRNAALATIFGSDAIRAANILYDQGGQGIQGWIDKTNDAGFAAETAATKMDNLKGDLEQFRGSLETALIGLGSSADGPLRSLVETATNVVNAFNDLGDGAKSAILTVAAGAGGLLLTAATVGKLAVVVNEASVAFKALGISAKTAIVGIPVIGVAIAAIGAGVSFFAGRAAEASQRTTDFGAALSGITGAITAQTAALNENVRATAAKQLQDTGALDSANTLGIGLATLTDAALGNADALTQVQAAVFAGRRGNSEAVAASLKLGGAMFSVSDAAKEAIAKQNQLNEATQTTSGATKDAASATQDAAAAQADAAAAAQAEVAALDALIAKTFAYTNAMLQLSGGQIGMEAAIDAATKAAKDNGKTLDVHTEKGRANQQALNALTAQTTQYTASLIKNGASAVDIVQANEEGRRSFISTAVAMGKSEKAAKAMAAQLFALPKDIKVQVAVPGAKLSAKQADDVNAALKGIPKEKRAEIVTIAQTKGAKAAKAAMDAVKDKTVIAHSKADLKGAHAVDSAMKALKDRLVLAKARGDASGARAVQAAMNALHDRTVTLRTVHIDSHQDIFIGGKKAGSAHASGGYISGPGTPTSDSIPAWLSDGEFVIRAAAVKAIGLSKLKDLNAKGYAHGGAVGFAGGGHVYPEPILRMIAQALDLAAGVRRADARVHTVAPTLRHDWRALEAAREDVRDDRRHHNKKELAKAEDALDKAEARHKKTADKAKEALDGLRQAQQALADAARNTSDQMSGAYRTQSLDIDDILTRMREGAVELAGFQRQLSQLRKLGLSEAMIRQISERGATQGGEIAAQIIEGGRKVALAMNTADANLTKAADKLGYDVESRASRHRAVGGYISGPGTGTSDSIPTHLSNGEYVVNAFATAANRGLLDAMNYGRSTISRNFTQGRYGGGYMQPTPPGRVINGGAVNFNAPIHVVDVDQLFRKAKTAQRDSLVMANLSQAI